MATRGPAAKASLSVSGRRRGSPGAGAAAVRAGPGSADGLAAVFGTGLLAWVCA